MNIHEQNANANRYRKEVDGIVGSPYRVNEYIQLRLRGLSKEKALNNVRTAQLQTTTTYPDCPVTIFEDGGVNLDGEDHDDLMKFWAWGGASGGTPYRAARAIFPNRPQGYVSATGSLRGYAANKATAMTCRARGDIQAALVYETICDRIYEELPEWAQW